MLFLDVGYAEGYPNKRRYKIELTLQKIPLPLGIFSYGQSLEYHRLFIGGGISRLPSYGEKTQLLARFVFFP